MADTNHYEVILSINGKHTPIAAWDDVRSGDLTLELVRYAYKQIVCWIAENPNNGEVTKKAEANAVYCKDHQVPMVWRKGKFGSFWSCPQKNEDGSYCKYRPPKE
jgi:hypothetical protein